LARAVATAAKANGARVSQETLTTPVIVGGVGNGTQTCKYALDVDLAVPTDDGSTATPYRWRAPIVEDSNLLGLLGLDSLRRERAIIDVGNKRMIYPGPGEVEYTLPPGSVTMPLSLNPNGVHLCLPVDEYVKAKQKQASCIKAPTPHFRSNLELRELLTAPAMLCQFLAR